MTEEDTQKNIGGEDDRERFLSPKHIEEEKIKIIGEFGNVREQSDGSMLLDIDSVEEKHTEQNLAMLPRPAKEKQVVNRETTPISDFDQPEAGEVNKWIEELEKEDKGVPARILKSAFLLGVALGEEYWSLTEKIQERLRSQKNLTLNQQEFRNAQIAWESSENQGANLSPDEKKGWKKGFEETYNKGTALFKRKEKEDCPAN